MRRAIALSYVPSGLHLFDGPVPFLRSNESPTFPSEQAISEFRDVVVFHFPSFEVNGTPNALLRRPQGSRPLKLEPKSFELDISRDASESVIELADISECFPQYFGVTEVDW